MLLKLFELKDFSSKNLTMQFDKQFVNLCIYGYDLSYLSLINKSTTSIGATAYYQANEIFIRHTLVILNQRTHCMRCRRWRTIKFLLKMVVLLWYYVSISLCDDFQANDFQVHLFKISKQYFVNVALKLQSSAANDMKM